MFDHFGVFIITRGSCCGGLSSQHLKMPLLVTRWLFTFSPIPSHRLYPSAVIFGHVWLLGNWSCRSVWQVLRWTANAHGIHGSLFRERRDIIRFVPDCSSGRCTFSSL